MDNSGAPAAPAAQATPATQGAHAAQALQAAHAAHAVYYPQYPPPFPPFYERCKAFGLPPIKPVMRMDPRLRHYIHPVEFNSARIAKADQMLVERLETRGVGWREEAAELIRNRNIWVQELNARMENRVREVRFNVFGIDLYGR